MNLALKGKCSLSLLIGLGLSLWLGVSVAQAQCPNDLCYVDASVTLTMTTGMSWTTAYTNLQDALAVAQAGDEIWVAAGVYYPDEGGGQTNDDVRASFALTDGVKIYGGFAGTETEHSQRQPRTNVTVLSGDIDGDDITDGQGVVTVPANISGLNAYHVIYNIGVSSTAVLDGFTITAGNADGGGFGCPTDCGGGMYNIGSSPQINQISFSGNRASFGGGMFNNNSSNPKISQVSFSGNRAAHGGGMYNNNSSRPEISQVSFSGNSADLLGGGMYNESSSPHIINSIFWGNATNGLINASAQIYNSSSSPVISYTLIQRSGGSSAWVSSLGMNGGHNLDADPLFREPIDPADAPTSEGNLRLRPGSPAIDAGDNRAASGPQDLDGTPRIQGRGVDLGAYETPAPRLSLSKAVSPARVEPGQRVTYTLVLSNSGVVSDTVSLSDPLPSEVEFAAWVAQQGAMENANEISWQGLVTAGESISITFAVTNRSLSGAITNRAQFSGSLQTGSSSVSHSVFRRRLYVDAAGMFLVPDGLRWTLAFTNLQDALAEAADGDEIWVAAGVYYPDEGRGQTNNDVRASFALKNGVKIYGGFAGTETERSQRQPRVNVTVLSGDIDGNDGTDSNGVVTTTANITGSNAYHVIYNIGVSSTAVLDGFTITAGDVNVGGFCPDNNNCGGGMYNIRSSPEINQISFRGNRAAAHGGGMVNWENSHPKISQVSFSGNYAAAHGGGMINSHSSHPKMSQVSFSGNAASVGGGMYNQNNSHPEMSQVSFSGNSATNSGGGMFNINSSPHIVNSIFWGNAANGLINASAQIMNTDSSTPTISYTLIQSSGGSSAWESSLGTDGGHNLDADPLFREPIDPADAPTSAGNLRLRRGSPAIDVGDDRAASGPQDLDGAPRIIGAGVDLGAYETGVTLSLSKAVSPVRVEPGQRVTYTLVLSNSGLGSDSVRLSDPLPSGVEFAAWVAQGGGGGGDNR